MASNIDKVISAEMPVNEADAALVQKFMMHSHKAPGMDGAGSYCQKLTSSGRYSCRFRYPYALQNFTTFDSEGRVYYRRRKPRDQWVVPHCLEVLRAFQCHINVEAANTSHIFSYLFKYVHKGTDRATFHVSTDDDTSYNEIELYWTGRYLSAGEAAWRILGFHITRKDPAVTCLPVHLEASNRHHQFYCKNSTASVLSLLDRYFLCLNGIFRDRCSLVRRFCDLCYKEYYTLFRLVKYTNAYQDREDYFEELPLCNNQVCFASLISSMSHQWCADTSGLHIKKLKSPAYCLSRIKASISG